MSESTDNKVPASPGLTADGLTMDIHEVMRRLPHRYPFLLVDRVLECVSGKHITALKNVTINEPFFPGHFPHRPVFPGVIILEALAQTAGILAFVTAGVYPDEHRQLYFVGIDNARFRRPVEPGDQLILKATLTRSIRGIWKFSTIAEVNGEEATSAEMMVAPGETRKG
jgi:3-hydroxyacyl-[acyl-carrier-protein] dehydratase